MSVAASRLSLPLFSFELFRDERWHACSVLTAWLLLNSCFPERFLRHRDRPLAGQSRQWNIFWLITPGRNRTRQNRLSHLPRFKNLFVSLLPRTVDSLQAFLTSSTVMFALANTEQKAMRHRSRPTSRFRPCSFRIDLIHAGR